MSAARWVRAAPKLIVFLRRRRRPESYPNAHAAVRAVPRNDCKGRLLPVRHATGGRPVFAHCGRRQRLSWRNPPEADVPSNGVPSFIYSGAVENGLPTDETGALLYHCYSNGFVKRVRTIRQTVSVLGQIFALRCETAILRLFGARIYCVNCRGDLRGRHGRRYLATRSRS